MCDVTQNYYLGIQKTDFDGDKCVLLVFSKLNTNFQSETLLNFNFSKLKTKKSNVDKFLMTFFFKPVQESRRAGMSNGHSRTGLDFPALG